VREKRQVGEVEEGGVMAGAKEGALQFQPTAKLDFGKNRSQSPDRGRGGKKKNGMRQVTGEGLKISTHKTNRRITIERKNSARASVKCRRGIHRKGCL